jgi:hypothetical protein
MNIVIGSSSIQDSNIYTGKINYTDDPKNYWEIRLNKADAALIKANQFPSAESPGKITLITEGDTYQTKIRFYEKEGTIRDATRQNGRHMKYFLQEHDLGAVSNEEIGIIFIASERVVLFKRSLLP